MKYRHEFVYLGPNPYGYATSCAKCGRGFASFEDAKRTKCEPVEDEVLSHRADGIETDKNGKPIPLSKKFKRREHKTNRK